MDIHNYHPVTGEYLSTTSADEDPLNPRAFLIPAHATSDNPPAPQQGQARVFVAGVWTFVPDHRGETWWTAHGEPVEIEELGGISEGLTQLEPPPPPAPPRTIHPAWLRLALIEIDKLDAVNAAVTSQGAVKVALWEYATTISENDPDVNAIASALSIDLDSVFDRGEAIRAARQG